jgi:PAS domain S-box-containing protein
MPTDYSRMKSKFEFTILNYLNRLYMRFQFNEYLAVHYAIKFWKELLSRHLNSSLVQKRGMEISRYFIKIQEIASEMRKLNPDDVKFLYKYGIFLIRIMNNEYDGIDKFTEAQTIFSNKILGKKNNGSSSMNERDMFGENSGAAIFMVQATSASIGQIIHVNDETEYQLGYQRQDLIEKNISCIQPDAIKHNHNEFLQKYLDTGKQRVIEHLLQMFPITKSGYCKLMALLIKIHT